MIDPKVCPFCKQPNACQAHIPNNDCWCNDFKIPEEMREYISTEFRMKACICKPCAQLFKENKEAFVKQYLK